MADDYIFRFHLFSVNFLFVCEELDDCVYSNDFS